MPLKKFRRLGHGATVVEECVHFLHALGNVRHWLMMKGETRDAMRAERHAKTITRKGR